MDILLKLKHRILFTVMMIPPIIADLAGLAGFWYWITGTWLFLVYIGWLFSIGNAVYNRESTSRFAIGLFNAGLIYVTIYVLYFSYNTPDISEFFTSGLILLHIGAMIVEIYLIFFVAKKLVRYENDHDLESKSIFLTFCAICCFPDRRIFYSAAGKPDCKQEYCKSFMRTI